MSVVAAGVVAVCVLVGGDLGAVGASPFDGRGHGRPPLPEVRRNPPAPDPEPIEVGSLPLPPTAPSAADGSVIPGGCANDTGCMSPADTGIQEGPSYMWDGEHVVLPVELAGAPEGSPYTGTQIISVKTTERSDVPER